MAFHNPDQFIETNEAQPHSKEAEALKTVSQDENDKKDKKITFTDFASI